VLPGSIVGVGWLDHWSSGQQGYPAVMVLDTLSFRYAHYGPLEDMPDEIDFEEMARVVAGMEYVVADLGGLC